MICVFPDVEDPRYPGAFGHAHAQRMIRFINGLSANLTEGVEDALDVADIQAEEIKERFTHEEVFSKLRESVNNGE